MLIIIVYLLAGYFLGAIANFSANFLHRALQKVSFLRKYKYTYWYDENAEQIDALYYDIFGKYPHLINGASVVPTDKVNALKEYFRRYNPDGYAEVYRQFMKFDLARVALLYSTMAILYECGEFLFYETPFNLWLIIVPLFVGFAAFRELPRRVQKVVRTEFFYIIATARIRDDVNAEARDALMAQGGVFGASPFEGLDRSL